MKSRVSFSDGSINIRTPIMMVLTASCAGALLLVAGVYMTGNGGPAAHLLAGTGIILLFSGLFFLFSSKYYKINLTDDMGYIDLIEATGGSVTPMKIPVKFFSDIIIQYLVNRERPEYEVLLRSRQGSFMLVARFNDEEKVQSFCRNFSKTTGLRVRQNSEIPVKGADVRGGFKPYNIVLPARTSVKAAEQKNSAGLTWRVKFSLVQVFFLVCIYYGILHLIHFAALPTGDINKAEAVAIYTFMGFLFSLLVVYIASVITGTCHLVIDKDTVRYFYRVFGKNYREMEIKKDDLAVVLSSIELSTEEIVILNTSAVDSINSLIKNFNAETGSKGVVDVSALKTIKRAMMRINLSHLRLAEKLYIEQFIMKRI